MKDLRQRFQPTSTAGKGHDASDRYNANIRSQTDRFQFQRLEHKASDKSSQVAAAVASARHLIQALRSLQVQHDQLSHVKYP